MRDLHDSVFKLQNFSRRGRGAIEVEAEEGEVEHGDLNSLECTMETHILQ